MSHIPELPFLGFGLGLRKEHYHDLLEPTPEVDWLEIITENFLVPGGKPLHYLEKLAERYPLVMHGVSMSLGSTDPLDRTYLNQVKQLALRFKAHWVSDHLCWTGVNQTHLHDLMPLPYTDEALLHVTQRIKQVQDILERPILIENVSSYVSFNQSHMSEAQFYTYVAEEANCLMLLDVNNVYVSSVNQGFDPLKFIEALPKGRVQQIHLAGHLNLKTHIIDTHDRDVIPPVWSLYRKTIERLGPVSTMIERDAHIPPLHDMIEELNQAKAITHTVLSRKEHEFA